MLFFINYSDTTFEVIFWVTRNEDREHVLQFNIDVALLLDRANNKYSICQTKK